MNNNSLQPFFLLGGKDLEMLAIRQLLLSNGYKENEDFLDKQLVWGAKLSSYQEDFPPDRTIIGIELIEDIPLPENYKRIDHHNEWNELPSAIEQVATLLRIPLTRTQQLIAANDRGYIPAMLTMGASEEEIKDIRQRDRTAQGVTEAEERLAQQSIYSNLTFENGVTIVESKTNKFSPIADRLYGKTKNRLLIFTDRELTYYGRGKLNLVENFQQEIAVNKMYHGGTNNGFFGISQGAYTKEELEELRKKIIKMLAANSYHIFLFPFQWDFSKQGKGLKDLSFKQRTSLEGIQNLMKSSALKDKWTPHEFEIKAIPEASFNTFSLYNYYHDFARQVLDLQINQAHEKPDPQKTILQYKYNLPENATYAITIYDGKAEKERTFTLDIDDIALNFYESGVGFLSFHLENNRTAAAEDILKINDYGRRLYPAFLSAKKGLFIDDVQKISSLPLKIELIGIDKEPIMEDFSYYKKEACIKQHPIQLPSHLSKLLGANFTVSQKRISPCYNSVVLRPIIDDRMYVMSYAFSNKEMAKLKCFCKNKEEYRYAHSPFWYAYIFVDSDGDSPTCYSKKMFHELLNKHTYDRWIDKKEKEEQQGLLYGITRYSFMMLVDDCFFTKNIANIHFQHHYFQMTALAVMQRASILRFSDEATRIVNVLKKSGFNRKLISEFYVQYLGFINKIYFREISPQEQGIELYALLRASMDIDSSTADLKAEIEEMNNYAMMVEASRLTRTATLFLPVTLVAAVFGFSNLPKCIDFNWALVITIFIFIITLVGIKFRNIK